MSGRDANQLAADVRAGIANEPPIDDERPYQMDHYLQVRNESLAALAELVAHATDGARAQSERIRELEAQLQTTRQALTEIAAGLGYPTLYREAARRALAATGGDTVS